MTVTRANVRPILQDPAQARKYAALGAVPADDVRAPISVYAVARELKLPYETVRRHVAKLVNRGLCVKLDSGGLIIPAQVFQSEEAKRATNQSCALARTFLDSMALAGAHMPSVRITTDDVRAEVARLSTDYFLNGLAILNNTFESDLIAGLVFLAITRANTRQIMASSDGAKTYGSIDAVPPDSLRTPISVYALARELSLPYETTRRYVNTLIKADLVERTEGGGLVAPARAHRREAMMSGTRANWQECQRFLTALSEVGLVAKAA